MGKVNDIVVDEKTTTFALLETINYVQREIARIEEVSRQTVERITYLLKESSCDRRMKTFVREDLYICNYLP